MESREISNDSNELNEDRAVVPGLICAKGLYLVERCADDQIGWDEFSAYVCAADSKRDAIAQKDICVNSKYGQESLIVTKIGITYSYLKSEVVLYSFHAG